jgi:5-methyltetrahydropteroyltriglutamate--homocysteine methyltransferase
MSAAPPSAYRCEPIGSLLRPDYLKQAAEQFEAGALSAEQLAAAQDRAVREAVALQEECGLDVITDGEMRRRNWYVPLTDSLAGFSRAVPATLPFSGTESAAPQPALLPAINDRLGPKTNLPLTEFQYLRQQTSRPCKTTLPSLNYASVLWVPGVSDKVYPRREEAQHDALRLVRDLIAEVVAAGARYVQLDAPRYTHLVSEQGRDNFRRVGIDPATWLGEMIALDNALVDGFPDVTFGLHLCRGNYRGMWAVEGGYDPIAEQLFNEHHAHRLLMEYDSPRAGTFEPLRFVPPDKTVVLGLMTTKSPEMETADLLRRRVDEAARYLPLDRLALSPQCGFASGIQSGSMNPDTQRAKLMLLSRVARDIWR